MEQIEELVTIRTNEAKDYAHGLSIIARIGPTYLELNPLRLNRKRRTAKESWSILRLMSLRSREGSI